MKSLTPVPRSERPPLPAFTPVPRKCARHDGWTPDRQRAFIAALADTGSVSRAAAMVNMASEGAYALRRHPEAGGFRAAWEAALDCGVARMKDIAFERAIDGYLVPCFAGGKLIGWRRKHNDRLLMFCLRHYGEDGSGKRTTINYFSTRATAAAGAGAPSGRQQRTRDAPSIASTEVAGTATLASARDAGPDRPAAGEAVPFDVTDSLRDGTSSVATASTTTVRTSISGGAARAPDLDHSAALIDTFDPAELDEPAREAIAAILADCAARRRLVEGSEHDPGQLFLPVAPPPPAAHRDGVLRAPRLPAPGEVEQDAFLEQSPVLFVQPAEQYRAGPEEMSWEMLDDEPAMKAIEDAVASVRAAKAKVPPRAKRGEGDQPPAGGGAKLKRRNKK